MPIKVYGTNPLLNSYVVLPRIKEKYPYIGQKVLVSPDQYIRCFAILA